MRIADWQKYFEDRGLDPDLLRVYLNYCRTLIKNKKPVIFEFEHLSLLLGINVETLARMVAHSEIFYRSFQISKRSGGKRDIFSPYRSLLSCQRWILKNILETVPLHDACHGFRKFHSIRTNAAQHLDSKVLLKMDLKDFFPSIKKPWVIQIFLEMGYAHNVAYYLASLCCYGDELAQGAATSPMIANIVCRSLDRRLNNLAKKYKISYTRYADDLTFSAEYIHYSFSDIVSKIVKDYGLYVNDKKTRLKVKAGARIVTGVSIENGVLSVPNKYKRSIKNEIFFIRKYGLLSHMSQLRISDPSYIYSLLGRVAYWLQIEPDNAKALEMKRFLSQLNKFT